MADYLTIDGGTTNTRINLVQSGNVTDQLKLHVGARSALSDAMGLRQEVKRGIVTLLERNNVPTDCIRAVIASGMITSESGLVTVPHIPAPAGVQELAAGLHEALLPEISTLPFFFVPGVRYTDAQAVETDVMRGEETECMGLMTQLGFDTSIVLLPGSHSKAICLRNGRIESFSTYLSGEMLAAIRESTILKASVTFDGVSPVAEELRHGYEYCEQEGVNKSLFKVRILSNFLHATPDQVYSFYSGVILHDEIRSLLRQPFDQIYLGGQTVLKRMMKLLLTAYSDKQVIELEDEVCEKASTLGAVSIFETCDRPW